MKHVILGNGPAGVIAAETIRKHANDDSIVLVGDEPEPPYSRMAIPYLLMGNIGEDGTYLRKDKGHFGRHRIELHAGRAIGIDTTARMVRFDDGARTPFRPAADRHRFSARPGADPRHRPAGGERLLDACRRSPDHGAGQTRRAGAPDGGRLHRVHHHGSAGRTRRAAVGRRNG